MKIISIIFFAILSVFSTLAQAQTIGKVDTGINLIGANPYIQVDMLVDPDIKGMTCHISYAKSGGLTESIGLSTDRSRFSLACRQTDQLVVPADIDKQKKISAFDRNPFFKEMIVTRMYDKANKTLIYLVSSKGLIDGSPFNSISTIPLAPWGAKEVIFK